MSELENIQKQIETAEKRRAEVAKELTDLKSQLIEKRREQGAAIVSDKDAEKLGKEVVTLQTRIAGAEEANSQLLDTLRELQENKTAELRSIARTQAENEKAEVRLIEADIYSSLVYIAKRLPDLRRKRADYVTQLRGSGTKDTVDEGRRISIVYEALKREIPSLLEHFPRSLLAENDLPSPSSVRSLMNS
jgi:predicted  nucleic acid-binding Zn-ribbon protein